MKTVSKKRKRAATQALSASKKQKAPRRVLGLNSSKQVDSEWYYSLADVETVIAAVLSELDNDPDAGITLEAGDNGIVLNVISGEGEEYTVDVDIESEGDEEAPDAAEGDVDEEPAEE